jgi:predicted permease
MNLRRRMRDDIDRDIRDHIDFETRENIERGMAPSEARAAALRKFGNPLRVAEDTRAVWRSEWVERLLQDVRYALRGLRRNPLFAGVVILTLALGIGLNTAVFSVVNAVLIEPLAYPHPERLLWLTNYNKAFKVDFAGGPDFVDWRAQAQSFDKIFCYDYGNQTVTYGNTTDQRMVAEVSDDFWPVAGVKPAAGRLFTDADKDVIVLTDSLFQRRFGADRALIGKTIVVDGHPTTVVGILPPGFRFLFPIPSRANIDPTGIEAYVPTGVSPANQVRGRSNVIVNVVARLKPGVSLQQARGEMEAIQARIVKQYSNILNFAHLELRVIPMQERLVGNARPALLILLGAVTFVLLIACANIAGLLLARASTRRREVAIRAAVGAGRLRMIAQLRTEGLVLALAGGAAGLLVARWAIALLTGFGPKAVPRLEGVAIDGRVLAFTALISIVSGLLFGLGPAISLARANLHSELKEGGKTTSGALRLRLRGILVAGELAAAMVLVIGAGLMVKSLWRMNAHPPGFNPESILVMKASLTGPAYRARPQQIAYFEEALNRLQRTPGVVAAGTVFSPMRGVIQIEGAPPPAPDLAGAHRGIYYSVSSGYFRVMGMRLLQGRWMTDNEPSEVMMVNETFVRKVLGGDSPLGKSIHIQFPQRPPTAPIVGVVSDVKYSKLDAEPDPEIYFPYRQSFFNGASDIVVRASGDPSAIAPAVRKLITGIDPSQLAFDMQTLESLLARTIAPRRFNLFLLGTFAGSSLLLALIGIYGAISYAVTQRTHEIGVRMALGARQGEILRMVIRQAMVVALTGIAAGIAAAFGLTRLMATLLYDVKPTDPSTFAAVAIAMTATSLLASWLPALKAARVDPLRALRYE